MGFEAALDACDGISVAFDTGTAHVSPVAVQKLDIFHGDIAVVTAFSARVAIEADIIIFAVTEAGFPPIRVKGLG